MQQKCLNSTSNNTKYINMYRTKDIINYRTMYSTRYINMYITKDSTIYLGDTIG